MKKEKHDTSKSSPEKVDKLATVGVQKHLIVTTSTGVEPKLTMPEGYRPNTLGDSALS